MECPLLRSKMDGHDLTPTLHSSNKQASSMRKVAVDSGFPPGQIQDGRSQTLDRRYALPRTLHSIRGRFGTEPMPLLAQFRPLWPCMLHKRDVPFVSGSCVLFCTL